MRFGQTHLAPALRGWVSRRNPRLVARGCAEPGPGWSSVARHRRSGLWRRLVRRAVEDIKEEEKKKRDEEKLRAEEQDRQREAKRGENKLQAAEATERSRLLLEKGPRKRRGRRNFLVPPFLVVVALDVGYGSAGTFMACAGLVRPMLCSLRLSAFFFLGGR